MSGNSPKGNGRKSQTMGSASQFYEASQSENLWSDGLTQDQTLRPDEIISLKEHLRNRRKNHVYRRSLTE